MPLYKNPDFRRLPPGLATVFDRSRPASFFALPQWYDLLARFGVPSGTEIRVYTDERPGSMVAVPLQISAEEGRRSLASLANFYSVEHNVIAAPDAELGRGLAAILAATNFEHVKDYNGPKLAPKSKFSLKNELYCELHNAWGAKRELADPTDVVILNLPKSAGRVQR